MIPSIRKFVVFAAMAACASQAAPAASLAGSATHPPACCSACAQDTVPRSLSDRSIYQLEATWNDDNGKPVKLVAFQGHPVVLAMFYTQCKYACPMIVAAMRQIQAALPSNERDATRFVLVSFDSEHDTSAVLRAYRQEMRLPERTWALVHGSSDAVRELAMVLGVKYQKLDQGQFAHSNLITVLNADGEIAYQRTGLQGDDHPLLTAITGAIK